jgi:hypothetical protein
VAHAARSISHFAFSGKTIYDRVGTVCAIMKTCQENLQPISMKRILQVNIRLIWTLAAGWKVLMSFVASYCLIGVTLRRTSISIL